MSKLESFASLNITGFQQSLKRMADDVAAFERNLQKKKFEVTLSVNTQQLDAIGRVSFDRITNSIKTLETAMKRVGDIKINTDSFKTIGSFADKNFNSISGQLNSLAKSLETVKSQNITFNSKSFSDFSKLDLGSVTKQISGLVNTLKNVGSINTSINFNDLQKLSTLNISQSIKQISDMSRAVKDLSGIKLNVGPSNISALNSINFTQLLSQIPQLATALKALSSVNININLKSIYDLAHVDIGKIVQGLNQLVPTLQKLNNINIDIRLPTGNINNIAILGNNFSNYTNLARSFGAAIGVISPQLSSMFYWTGRVAESLGLYNNASTLSRFNTVALVGSIGALVTVFSALGAVAVEQGQKFENAFAILRANGVQTLNAIKTSIESIRDLDISTARRGLSDYAEALANLTKAGQSGAEGLEILKQASYLATAEGTNLSETAIELTRNLLQFKLTANDAARAVDSLTLASNDAVGTQSDLSKGLNTVGSIAKQAGFSFEETLAALVELDNKGLSAADKGATALRNVLAAATSPTAAFRRAAKELGVDLVDMAGNTRSGRDVVLDLVHVLSNARVTYDELTGEVKGNADAVAAASTLFRTRGFAAILSMSDGLETLAKKYRDGKGAAKDYADTLSNTFTGSVEKLKASFKDAGTNLFVLVGPTLVEGIKLATGAITGFRDVLNTLSSSPAFTQSLLAVGGAMLFLSNAAKIASISTVAFNTVAAFLVPIGQAGVVSLTGFNIAFARLSLGAQAAAIAVGLFNKAATLLTLNPVIAVATAGFVALSAAILVATKNYEDMGAAAEKQIQKNNEFIESLKKARKEGEKVSPELGNLKAREFVQLDNIKNAAADPNTTVAEMNKLVENIKKTREEIKNELKKFAAEDVVTFSVSEETQQALDALDERAKSLAIRFGDVKDQALDKTFLDISASIRELIKGLDAIPEVSGNSKIYQGMVDKYSKLENDLQAQAIEKSIADAKRKNSEDFANVEKEKTAILKDESAKRKIQLEQELKDIEEKYNKQLQLANKNLDAASRNKNINPSELADLSGIISQIESNKAEALKTAREKEIADQKVILQQRLEKEAEVNNKIITLRQQAGSAQLELLKTYQSAIERQYALELDLARDNISKKIDIDQQYRSKILDNIRKQAAEQAKIDKTAAKQQLDSTLLDARKIDNSSQRDTVVSTAKSNYDQQIKNINIKYAQEIKNAEIDFDKQVADHRRALNETYYKAKLDSQRAYYDNETRYIDSLSAKELQALRTKFEAQSASQRSAGNTRSADLTDEFTKKIKAQQQSNIDELTRKTPELVKSINDVSNQLNAALNNQDNSLSKFIEGAADKYTSIVSKAADQMQTIKDLIDKAGVTTPAQQAMLARLQSIIDLANAKAEQAKVAAKNLYNRNLNDNATDRSFALAGRTYDRNADAKSYEEALSLYEDYWKKRLEIAKQNQDPQERATEVAAIEDRLNDVYDKRNHILANQQQLKEQAIKLDIESLQYQVDQTDSIGDKSAKYDAILSKLREQLSIQQEIVKNPASEKERLDALSSVLQITKEIDSITQKKVQTEIDGVNQQKAAIQAINVLREAEIGLQAKSAATDTEVLRVYDLRIAQSKEQISLYRNEISELGKLRDKYTELSAAALSSGDIKTGQQYKSAASDISNEIAKRNADLINEQSAGLDLQKQKQDEINKFQLDSLSVKEALIKAQDAITGRSRDAVEAARTELAIAEERRRVAEQRLKDLPANQQGIDSVTGRTALKDVADAVQKEADARKNLNDEMVSSANALLDKESSRRKLALEIAGLDNDQVEIAKIDLDISERKLAIIKDEMNRAADLVSYGKAYQDYQDKALEVQKQKNDLVKLEADLRFKSANDQNDRDLRIAQARLSLSVQAGDEVAAQTLQLNAAIKSLEILQQHRGDLAPGSSAYSENEVKILEAQVKVLDLSKQKNAAIADQRRANIDLLHAQLTLEAKSAGYGQDSVEAIRIQIATQTSVIDTLKSQLSTASSKIDKERLLKQVYEEELNLLNLQDAKAKSIADNRKLSLDQTVSAKELDLTRSGTNTAANQADLNLSTDRELAAILQEQLASTTDINEKKRISIQLNQVLKKQYDDQKAVQDAIYESQKADVDIKYARAQLSIIQAGADSDGVAAAEAQLNASKNLLAIELERFNNATNQDDKQKAELSAVNAQIRVEQDLIALSNAKEKSIINSLDAQNQLAQAAKEYNDVLTGVDVDIVKSAQAKLNADQMDLRLLFTKLEIAKTEEDRNSALLSIIQKQISIKKDMIAVENAIYARQKSQLELQDSQVKLLEKQASVSAKLQGSDGSSTLDAQIAINSALSEREQKLQEIRLLESKVPKSIDEEIDMAKEKNKLQFDYLDALGREADARRQLRDAEIKDLQIREQLANAQFDLRNQLSAQPTGVNSDVLGAQQALADANRNLSQAGNMANEILGRLSKNGEVLASDVDAATGALSKMTSAIQSQRSALNSLANAYESQIQNAISLSKSVISAQQVFSAAGDTLTPENAKEQMSVYNELISSVSSLRTALSDRLTSLLNDDTATVQMITSAISDLTSAEQDRRGLVKNFNDAAKVAGEEIRKSINDGFSLDYKAIVLANQKVAEITKNEEAAKKAREDAAAASQNNLATALDLFVKSIPELPKQMYESISGPINDFSDTSSKLTQNLSNIFGGFTRDLADILGKKISLNADIPLTQDTSRPVKNEQKPLLLDANSYLNQVDNELRIKELQKQQDQDRQSRIKEESDISKINKEIKEESLRMLKLKNEALEIENKALPEMKKLEESSKIQDNNRKYLENKALEDLQDEKRKTQDQRLATEKARLESLQAQYKADENDAKIRESYAAKSASIKSEAEQDNFNTNKKINAERVKQEEIRTQLLQKELGLLESNSPSGQNQGIQKIVDAISEIVKNNTSWTEAALNTLKDYASMTIEALNRIKDSIENIKIVIPQLSVPPINIDLPQIQPSLPERSGPQPIDNSKTITFNFGDVTQNITTPALAPNDIPKLVKNIRIYIQNEFENLGGGC